MPPTAYGPTLDFHRLIAAELPPEDGQDRADAERGFRTAPTPNAASSAPCPTPR